MIDGIIEFEVPHIKPESPASIGSLLFTSQLLFHPLHEALAKIGNSCSCGSNIWREIQPPADFAINVHGVVHIIARSLPPIDLFHDWPQSRFDELQAFLARNRDLREIPVKLNGIQKPIPSRLTGVKRGGSEYVSVIDGGRDHGSLQLCANGEYSACQSHTDQHKNEASSISAHPEIVHPSVPVITFGTSVSRLPHDKSLYSAPDRRRNRKVEIGPMSGDALIASEPMVRRWVPSSLRYATKISPSPKRSTYLDYLHSLM